MGMHEVRSGTGQILQLLYGVSSLAGKTSSPQKSASGFSVPASSSSAAVPGSSYRDNRTSSPQKSASGFSGPASSSSAAVPGSPYRDKNSECHVKVF